MAVGSPSSRPSSPIRRVLAGALLFAWIAACATVPIHRAGPIEPARVLVLPALDGTPAFASHPSAASGTGLRLERAVGTALHGAGWEVVYTSSRGFDRRYPASLERARLEGMRLEARYVLRLELGEVNEGLPVIGFQDAATLETAELIEVSTGRLLWALGAPLKHGTTTSIGQVWTVIDDIGVFCANSIVGD